MPITPLEQNDISVSEFQFEGRKTASLESHQCERQSVACLLNCAEFYLEIQDCTDAENPLTMARLEKPIIEFKHCTKKDQNDALDDRTQGLSTQSKHYIPDQIQQLAALETTYPLKNKTKSQNAQISNFEKEDAIKQETFMLTFSTEMLQIPMRFIGRDTSRCCYMFNVTGVVHGQQVFSDVLFYMLKGGKLVNCLLSQINGDLLNQIDSRL